MRERLAGHETALAATLYALVSLAMTWPLPLGLTRDLPWDLGDPVLNCFILERNAQRMLAFLGGDLHALAGFWDARIFHPEPLTLAYSEHLFAETLQILPIYALTKNILLSYNLLFLSTFVLSALGMFLLVRAVTGRTLAALLAGFVFGFAPYRVEQFSHVQVLSSQWMPFVLLGLHRYFEARRSRALFLAALAFVVLGLSCGYHLLFFSPFVAAYVLFELIRRRLHRDRSVLRGLGLAGLLVLALSVPFLWPYRELRGRGGTVRERPEVEQLSADVYAYLTAPEEVRFWGEVARAYPASEGQLFPGLIPLVLAGLAIGVPARRMATVAATGERRRWPIALSATLTLAALAAALVILAGGGGGLSNMVDGLRVRSLTRPLAGLAIGLAGLLASSSRAREACARALGSLRGFGLIAFIASVVLSFGPTIKSLGEPLAAGPYRFLYEFVPGFDGLRVPARFAMVGLVFLALLAGIGAAEIAQRTRRASAVTLGLCMLFLLEATAAPLVVNDVWSDPMLRRPPARLTIGDEAPAIYRRAAALPAGSVLIEFPFGSDPYELRYLFHQPIHDLPLVNGFSGFLPESYRRVRGPLRAVLTEPERATRALRATTATHAIVHEGAWGIPAKGHRVTRWLEANGAEIAAREGSDVLLRLAR